MLSYKECHKDFRFALAIQANLCRKINGYDYFSSHLLSDNCDAITKDFRKQIWIFYLYDEFFVGLMRFVVGMVSTDIHRDYRLKEEF